MLFLGHQRRPYIVFRFRFLYGFMFVYMYILEKINKYFELKKTRGAPMGCPKLELLASV